MFSRRDVRYHGYYKQLQQFDIYLYLGETVDRTGWDHECTTGLNTADSTNQLQVWQVHRILCTWLEQNSLSRGSLSLPYLEDRQQTTHVRTTQKFIFFLSGLLRLPPYKTLQHCKPSSAPSKTVYIYSGGNRWYDMIYNIYTYMWSECTYLC